MTMTREEAVLYLKGMTKDYLQKKGLPIEEHRNFKCINSHRHKNNDQHPSMSYNPKKNNVHCFVCGDSYDIFDLIGIDYGFTDFNDQLKKACEMYNVEIEYNYPKGKKKIEEHPSEESDYIVDDEKSNEETSEENQMSIKKTDSYIEQCQRNLGKSDYLQKRGISVEIAIKMGIGYAPEFKTKYNDGPKKGQYTTWKGIVIRTGPTSYTIRNTATDEEIKSLYDGALKKERYRNRGKVVPFNLEAIKNREKPVFIVEGEIDAISIIEAGGQAVGIGGTQSVKSLLKYIKNLENYQIKQPLIIALDNDLAGVGAKEELIEGLNELKDKGVKYYSYDIARGYKDPNEALIHDRDNFVKKICKFKDEESTKQMVLEEVAEKYQQKNAIKGKIDNFVNKCIKGTIHTECYSTGIDGLDHLMDGGMFAGVYYLGALSGLGKTTFALQVADHVAKSGHDVLYFSLEMATNELIAKSISRHTYLRSNADFKSKEYAKTTRGILTTGRHAYNEKEKTTIIKALEDYYGYAENHIYIYEGVGDIGVEDKIVNKKVVAKGIRSIVEEHVKMAEISPLLDKIPLVVIDYLQILAPYDNRGTDKQNTDKRVVEIKRMSRDFNIPVICISAFNRTNYDEPVNMSSFRDSSSIEYGADCLLGLQYEGMDYTEEDKDKNNGTKNRSKRLYDLETENEIKAKTGEPLDIEVKIIKQRNGIRGKVALEFLPAYNYYKQKEEKSKYKRRRG